MNSETFMNPQVVQIIKKEHPVCFRCGSKENLEWHHGCIGREKKFSEWLDVAENGIMLCHKCNCDEKGFVENFKFRNLVFNWKMRNGYDMKEWLWNLPMKVKDNFHMMSDIYFKQMLKELTWRKE